MRAHCLCEDAPAYPRVMSAITENYGWTEHAPGSTDYIAPAIVAKLEALGARTVLDAGCGNGSVTAKIAAAGMKTLGIDGDEEGIAIARKHYPELEFSRADFAASGSVLDGAPFDAVVSTEVVEHLFAPHELARFAWEALKPGGHFIVTTPYHGYWKNLALSLAGKWDHHHTALWHGGHIKFFSRKTLEALLAAQGFEIESFSGLGRAPYLWKSMMMTARKPLASNKTS